MLLVFLLICAVSYIFFLHSFSLSFIRSSFSFSTFSFPITFSSLHIFFSNYFPVFSSLSPLLPRPPRLIIPPPFLALSPRSPPPRYHAVLILRLVTFIERLGRQAMTAAP